MSARWLIRPSSCRRVVFLGGFLALASAAVSLRALPVALAAGGPAVQTMVVGAGGGILSPPRTVTASATTVRIGARSCGVASGTALAALSALRQDGGPGFALRDYGRCGAAPVNSGQLFVTSLAGQSNRGQDGWEYKVNGVSGSTGAADPSGAQGNGRLLGSGQRLLWFWCRAHAGGCQRTLEVIPSSHSVSRGAFLPVQVGGYDNEGHAVGVPGAIVTLGADFASTAGSGRATLIAPSAPGRYELTATRPGLVPSFPETIVVR